MQKQQDMGKARWLSKPTLVGGVVTLHSRHYRMPKDGFLCLHTHSRSSPNILNQLSLGQEIAPPHHRRGGGGPG